MQKFDKIGEDLFNKLRGKFPSITIGDEDGNITNEPSAARFFDFSYSNDGNEIGKVSVSISEDDGLTVIYSKDIVEFQDDISKKQWFNFLKELRVFSKKRLLDFSIRDINKSNLTKKDYKFLAQRSGDGTMTESKLYGTSRISYQNVGEARIMIKHTESVNQETATGRTQKIGKIYIESPDGERFRYPFKHLSGARAMARHVAEGGNAYDDFGKHIVGLSEEMGKLRKFKNYMGRSAVMAESLSGYMDIVKERISTVKKTIENLQKPNHYKETFEAFETPVLEDVPSDVAENWIDELTIKQFNEELQDIFPYIYNLVKEGTKAKELGPDDLLGESDEQLDELGPALLIPALATAARAAAPKLAQIGARILSKGAKGAGKGAAAVAKGAGKGAAAVAKGAGKVAIKNPGTTAAIGGGAYIGKQASDAIDDLATSAGDILVKAEGGIEAIQGEISAFLGGGAVKQVAAMAAKYALPALAVVAILYGGKKVINWLMGKGKEPQAEDIDLDESGLQYYTGVKKHGKEYMKKAAQAGREGASQEELGKLKDKYSKAEKKTKEEVELEAAFEATLGQFSEEVCEECGNQSWTTLGMTEEEIEEGERHGNSKIYDKCWKGYRKVPGKKAGEKGSCKKIGESEYDASDIMSEDPPIGIDFDFDNLSKVDWDKHSDEAVKGFVSNLENLDFEDGVDVSDTGYSGSYRKAAKWVTDNVLAKRKKEGNAFAHAVRKAKMDGKKKGDKIQGPDGDEITLEKEAKTPLGEFILSYYDRETGQFPKGETAVLTMVEKDYGEQFIEPAKAFIESVNQTFEQFQMQTQPQQMEEPDTSDYDRMRELAGLR